MDVVEKLREWADMAADGGNYPADIAKLDLGLGISMDAECALFCLLADEVERNYIPIPLGTKLVATGEHGEECGSMDAGRLSGDDPGQCISANGVQLKEGMTVWVTMEHAKDCGKGCAALDGKAGLHGCRYGEPRRIRSFKSDGNVRIDLDKPDCAWCPASWLTTEEPDTQERIDRDKMKDVYGYWRCAGESCERCPAIEDGKTPRDRYGTRYCGIAHGLDIARRQAALDAAMKGE